jgi:hypothetical protein
MTTTEIEVAAPTQADGTAWPTLEELDVLAAQLPRRSYDSVKYAGVRQPAGVYVDHQDPNAEVVAWVATVVHGLRNVAAAKRFGYHHGRSVRQAKYACDVRLHGVNTLIVRRPERCRSLV